MFFAVSKNEMNILIPENKTDDKPTLNKNLIKLFEIKFIDKTDPELNGIAGENSKFQGAEKVAAKRILNQKNVL